MPEHPSDRRREAVLVARAWREAGAEPPLRVRLTMTTDIASSRPHGGMVVASISEVADAVTDWLSRYLEEGA